MARARATCTCEKCGKTFEVTAFRSNRAEAYDFEEWAAANITMCRDCKIAEEHAKSLEESGGMPELTGSEKQIKWAIDIRAAKTREAKKDRLPGKQVENGWASILAAKTEAKWWIDHRDKDAEGIFFDILREEPDFFADLINQVKADIFAEIDRFAASEEKDVARQALEVRKAFSDVFADPRVTPYRIMVKFSGRDLSRYISRIVRGTLSDKKMWDSDAMQWVDRPEDREGEKENQR